MTSKTVQNTVRNPSGTAIPNARIRVYLSGPGFRESDYSEVAPLVENQTNAAGLWQIPLECNDTITPDNTFYRVIEEVSQGQGFSREWIIQVFSYMTSPVNLYDTLIEVPPPNQALEDYLTAEEADALFLTPAEGDSRYELKPHVTGYTHDQMTPAATWVIVHNLGYYPGGIHVSDSGGSDCEGEITHDSVNQLTLSFGVAFSGRAIIS